MASWRRGGSFTNPKAARGAFTLVEALVATALALVVSLTAFAAVRAASACVTRCDRLGLENRLLRHGVQQALDALDFWTPYDDPSDATRQPLRAAGSHPFRPLTFDARFDLSQPRAWWRGEATGNPGPRDGDFGMFARLGHPDPDHAWLPTQIVGIDQALGHYGLIDYMPADTVYQAFAEDGTQMPEFQETETTTPLTRPRLYIPIGVTNGAPRDLAALTFGAAYAVTTDPGELAAGVDLGGFADYVLFGPLDPRWKVPVMHAQCPVRWQLMQLEPSHWPSIEVNTRRFVYYCRFVALAQVTMHDPLSGESLKLQFTCATTSLRGARQQRGLDTYSVP